MSVRPHGDTKCSSETEIGQLQVVILVNQQVLGFEISMQNSM